MKPPPPLRAEMKTSRCAYAAIVGAHAATAALVVLIPLPYGWGWTAAIVIVAACIAALRRIAGRHAPASLCVGIDRAIAVIARDGGVRHGIVLADSYVGARLTTIVWRPAGARRPRAMLLLPDSLGIDDFRRLRVLLRYGRVPGDDPATSGVDAA